MAIVVVFEGLPGSGITTAIDLLQPKLVPASLGRGVKISNVENFLPKEEKRKQEVLDRLLDYAKSQPYGLVGRNTLFWLARLSHDAHLSHQAQPAGWFQAGDTRIILVDRLWGTLIAHSGLHHIGIPPEDQDFWDNYPEVFVTKPNLTILIDTSIKNAAKRFQASQSHKGLPPLEDEILEGIRQKYQQLARKYHWLVVSGDQPIDQVVDDCFKAIAEMIRDSAPERIPLDL